MIRTAREIDTTSTAVDSLGRTAVVDDKVIPVPGNGCICQLRASRTTYSPVTTYQGCSERLIQRCISGVDIPYCGTCGILQQYALELGIQGYGSRAATDVEHI